MRGITKNKWWAVLAWLALIACQRTQDMVIPIPNYTPELVVECYLEPEGFPLLTLSQSSGYFEPILDPLYDKAQVILSHQGLEDTLRRFRFVNPFTQKVYNFVGLRPIAYDTNATFRLKVVDSAGRVLTGFTTFPTKATIKQLSIDKVGDRWEVKGLIPTPPKGRDRFYRVIFNAGSITKPSLADVTLDSRDFVARDLLFFSGYRFSSGDTAILRTTAITQGYYNFLTSLRAAQSANGNPFAQPAVIQSTVEGGLGVFATTAYRIDTVIIPR